MNKETYIAALKKGAKAFAIAFIGALGFGAVSPDLIAYILKLLGV